MSTAETEKPAVPASVPENGLNATAPPQSGEQFFTSTLTSEEFFSGTKTQVRVLVVADGLIGFVSSLTGFGLTELIDNTLMKSAMPWEELEVVKAHRRGPVLGALGVPGAHLPSFRFDAPPAGFSLDSFDQIWLFGQASEGGEKGSLPLEPAELSALADFMNRGGGVFATGDHDTLGAALCGNVPRVRSMRKWVTQSEPPPPRNGLTRIDTLREGFTQGFMEADQSDSVPQEIHPIFRLNKTDDGSQPHDLLKNGDLAITVLPDHMHEGECVIPDKLDEELTLSDGTPYKEYPPAHDDPTQRLAPDLVAMSVSASGSIVGARAAAPPLAPRLFKTIVAYDGHRARKAADKYEKDRVGRVVVDSSFHHFLDINLKGICGNRDSPTRDCLAIKRYFRNILLWLLPPEKQASYYMNMLRMVRNLSPLVEVIRPVKDPTWPELLFAGQATHQAISEKFSRADAVRCALVAASTLSEELRTAAEEFLDPWRTEPETTLDPKRMFINADLLLKIILGGAMLGIADEEVEQPVAAPPLLSAAAGDSLQPSLQDHIAGGLEKTGVVLKKVIAQSYGQLGNFLVAFKSHP
jgi:hypothetical protein